MTHESQEKRILAWLQEGLPLTPLMALNQFYCLRLSGRIYDLRKKGHNIQKEIIKTPSGKRIAQYFLPK